ncbi:S-layer homology domain-containing protein [Paenibacillus thalictri]|uniref:S-layer homology domain-containing protein n=1 Tax=Paenibacillus thalictri TaxID=2527873 RepID=A0A4Q9DUN8_9BACL|nr:S-layer homology domain-containing protein [Paenibacillus thalictri]TBL78490.1 S-layer homology domain-containing protein [Paenibacillus thalictri]
MKKQLSILSLSIAILSTQSACMMLGSHRAQAESSVIMFSDIQSHWGKDTIEWAIRQGIANGYEDGSFKPNENVSESEFLAMLVRAYNPDIKSGQGNEWDRPYYEYAIVNNYPVMGASDPQIRSAGISRTRVAELISSTQGVNYSNNDAIRYMLGNSLASGSDPHHVTISGYNGSGLLTRAEAAQFIKNLLEHGNKSAQPRPKKASDSSKLANIPEVTAPDIAEQPTEVVVEQQTKEESNWVPDLPYQPPAGWVPPLIKSTASDSDQKANWKALDEELGLVALSNGAWYNSRAKTTVLKSFSILGGDRFLAQIDFRVWKGTEYTPEDYKVPYIAREVFKFYFPESYQTLFKIMDDGYSGKDVSEYIGKILSYDGRQVKIIETDSGVRVVIGRKGVDLP